MKQIHKLVIAVALIVAVGIIALEVFDSHPSFTIGQHQVRWAGVRHLGFTSVDGANMINGQLEKITIHRFGPIRVFAIHG